MKTIQHIIAVSFLFSSVYGGEYPVVVNNFQPMEANEDYTGPHQEFFLYKNQLVKTDDLSKFIFDSSVGEGNFPQVPTSTSHTDNNGTPRNFLIGTYDETTKNFTYRSAKFVSPSLSVASQNKWMVTGAELPERKPEYEFGVENIYDVDETPRGVGGEGGFTRSEWENKQDRFQFKLDPPLPIHYVTDTGDPDKPVEPGQKLVQGNLELGGALVCGRREEGVLTLYRFSCAQNTYPAPLEVFNPQEKLAWDEGKSDAKALAAFRHLRPDLVEHNTGLTENRLYVRMKPYTVKLDKPGGTKALRDWYLLAPFYDPATQTSRETLTRADFVVGDGFDPEAADFDPAVFVKKLIPYTLPAGFWESHPVPSE